MALHLSIVLFFTGLTGTHSITTVSKVSVEAGGSISIPCLYDSMYTHHVKYLCEGYYWSSCFYAVKTNQPSGSGRFSISDDKKQRIFNVTIKNLKEKDNHFWCAVEINGRQDKGTYFQLSVTRSKIRQLYVDHQEMTGFKGDDITINCKYGTPGKNQWCRLGGPCVEEPSGSIHGTRVTIGANVPGVFTVTMIGLRTESSGWYLGAKGDVQMPVHVTVRERPSTAGTTLLPTATHTTITSSSHLPDPVSHTAISACETPTTVESEQHSASIYPLSFIIPLTLLIFIIMTTSLIWFILKRRKQSSAQSSAATAASHAEGDVDVTYSVVTIKKRNVQMVEAEDEGVIYSPVVHQ